jgi:phenylpropionate dioxygenase-like ring-hydroxylating dioxygenase large terminal subunit
MYSPARRFVEFEELWTPIERSARVRAGAPVRVRVAGTDVVLFRPSAGAIAALVDRCPHRGVALSLGRVGEDGAIECPFHGWRFDANGRCAHVPLCEVPEGARAKMGATPLVAREIGGLVWLWTGAAAPASGPDVHPMLADDAVARSFVVEEWSAHWTRAMENMLDFPHLPVVHRRTIGAGLRSRRPERMDLEVARTDYGMDIRATVDGTPLGEPLQWRRPNGMVLTLSARPGARLVQHVFCVPVDRERTRMIVVSTRDGWRWSPLGWLGDRFNAVVLSEDRRVVESSSPSEVPDPSDERSVAIDAPTLAFRRWYLRTLLEKRRAPDVVADAERRDEARG